MTKNLHTRKKARKVDSDRITQRTAEFAENTELGEDMVQIPTDWSERRCQNVICLTGARVSVDPVVIEMLL